MEVTLDEVVQTTYEIHEKVMKLHFRAIACHCECLGMNAENCHAMCIGSSIPYGNDSYLEAMLKWGLINEEGKPVI